jgi:leucyl-tRNA synthetase
MSHEDPAVENLTGAIQSQLAVSPEAGTTNNEDNQPKQQHRRWTLLEDSNIDYGYLAKTGGEGISEAAGGFYLTTAINYTNGPAHMGHAYEAATSDVISRYHRLKGDQPCYFVTGADEHGQKIANTAEAEGKEPQEICDKVCKRIHVASLLF